MIPLLTTLALLAGGGMPASRPATVPTPQPLQTAAAESSPTFLLLSPPLKGATQAGKPVPPEQLNLRVFRLLEAAKSETVFDVQSVGEVTVKGPFPPQLWPLLNQDTELAQVRQKYAGRTVYLRSGGMTCQSGGEMTGTLTEQGKGVKILNLYRLNKPYDVETRGFDGGGPYQRTAQAYAVIFEGKASLHMSSAGGGDEKQLMDFMGQGAASPACARLRQIYADPVMLSRFLSLTPPPKVKAQHTGLVGKTAEEALWLAGVPDLSPGTPEELYRLSEWRYANLPGLGDGIVRFQNGRVVSEDWPRLP